MDQQDQNDNEISAIDSSTPVEVFENFEAESEATVIRKNAYGDLKSKNLQMEEDEDLDDSIQILENRNKPRNSQSREL